MESKKNHHALVSVLLTIHPFIHLKLQLSLEYKCKQMQRKQKFAYMQMFSLDNFSVESDADLIFSVLIDQLELGGHFPVGIFLFNRNGSVIAGRSSGSNWTFETGTGARVRVVRFKRNLLSAWHGASDFHMQRFNISAGGEAQIKFDRATLFELAQIRVRAGVKADRRDLCL